MRVSRVTTRSLLFAGHIRFSQPWANPATDADSAESLITRRGAVTQSVFPMRHDVSSLRMNARLIAMKMDGFLGSGHDAGCERIEAARTLLLGSQPSWWLSFYLSESRRGRGLG